MSEQPVVNGEARQRIAVLERIHEDCARAQDVRHADNRQDHVAIFERLGRSELMLAKIETRVLMISGGGAFVGAAAVQIIIRLLFA